MRVRKFWGEPCHCGGYDCRECRGSEAMVPGECVGCGQEIDVSRACPHCDAEQPEPEHSHTGRAARQCDECWSRYAP